MGAVEALLSWQRVLVDGSSMTPTLLPGDVVLVRHGAAVRPGAVVLGRFRSRPDLAVIKRVSGPGSGGWMLTSDNRLAGADSRQYGIADVSAVAVRVWHRGAARRREGLLRRLLGHRLAAAPPEGL
jgi:SOS-response transcriptional repressor LexA